MSESRPKSDLYPKAMRQQMAWKASSSTLPESARVDGKTWVDGRFERLEVGPYPICLPVEHAALNLLASVREESIRRFQKHNIQWHGWTPTGVDERICLPSTHLLDSQVQCVNVLLSLARERTLFLDAIRRIEPDASDFVTIEDGSPFAFEWIGEHDYLGEGRGRPRHRGRFVTSADAVVVVERRDGGRTGILLEWKFTESYHKPVPFVGEGGKDRREMYRPLYNGQGTPFTGGPDIEVFFHEPHYQLLRQALLASEMVKAGEFGIDRAILLHCVPSLNETLRRTVPASLANFGTEIDQVWHRLLPGPSVRYACVDTMSWLSATPELAERYGALAGKVVDLADFQDETAIGDKRLPVHPGEILLEEFLVPLGLSRNRLAKGIAVSPRRVNEIVYGTRGLTADAALRLARYFGTTAEFWMNLQSRYDLERARDEVGDQICREVQVLVRTAG